MKAAGQLSADTKLRSSKYLNNLIEQDHRGVKLRIGPMLGFKRFRTAATTIAGIELLRRIHKGQFNLGRLPSKIELRPPSGTRCWQRNKAGSVTLKSASCRPPGYLHQNPGLDNHHVDAQWAHFLAQGIG
jgi:hypothetical protein